MALTRVTPLATVVEGDQHFADRVQTWAWDEATQEQQETALAEATEILNKQRWRGTKTESDQANEWPRDGIPNVTDGTTPDDIKRACIEIAYSLLAGDYRDERFEDNFVRRESIGGQGATTFNSASFQPYLAAGIPSMAAWTYLNKYRALTSDIRLIRASA
jgi:hypothetical protein